ncbi:hypothetical protein F5Y18DRAFT_418388 [Xylariaceae sp. FL1019]|nr:hypothetical protein F5Y18DRAFT_418388 [Xylariaceae sp. FL1019]
MTFAESAIRNAPHCSTYATAWGVFNTIRCGLVMVPGQWRRDMGGDRRPKATWQQILSITRPVLLSLSLALVAEVPIAIFLSLFRARAFAHYISISAEVAGATTYMWYLYQSVANSVPYVLPCSICGSFVDIIVVDGVWAWTLGTGKARLEDIRK